MTVKKFIYSITKKSFSRCALFITMSFFTNCNIKNKDQNQNTNAIHFKATKPIINEVISDTVMHFNLNDIKSKSIKNLSKKLLPNYSTKGAYIFQRKVSKESCMVR